jgi:choline kinase
MQAVIIAAGRGRRLAARTDTKPLLRVAGRPLLEHVLDRMRSIGVLDFVIVTGYHGPRIREFMNGPAGAGIRPVFVHNPDWRRGNGLSVLRAKGAARSPFFLLMSDHLFDPSIAADLRTAQRRGTAAVLAVDRRIENHPWVDLDDVTKVRIEEPDRIVEIGKSIFGFNAFDTGLFLCTTELFPALEESLGEGDDTLSGGIRCLAAHGLARTFDIGSRYWIDVDDPAALEKAEFLVRRLKKKEVSGCPAC